MKRCEWVNEKNSIYCEYHDKEWGVPVYDDRKLFEMLILEGVQAGLSWEIVLKKREAYRLAYDNFVPATVAGYNDDKIEELMNNSGLVRNRNKINASVSNAKIYCDIQAEYGSFSEYLWAFVRGAQIKNCYISIDQIPAKTELSEQLSADLKRRGMKFVGPVIVYSYMQAVGLVNDHIMDCFRYSQV
ncbi:MAG: DNA-3-methyladenine glycosylase I [Spirochaetes bacterium]|nr:DNA-3-methyladenine glycosylase I [Spirochaetota bacterium]